MRNDDRRQHIVALLWPAGKDVDQTDKLPMRSFTLVSTLDDYAAHSTIGNDAILIHRRPSDHFSVPLLVRVAGPLIWPWRWRRVLLNEGITQVIMPISLASLPLAIAATLSRSRIGWLRTWHFSSTTSTATQQPGSGSAYARKFIRPGSSLTTVADQLELPHRDMLGNVRPGGRTTMAQRL